MDLTDYKRKKIECWGEKHSNYVGRLTSILKDRKEGSVTDLTVIWTELLDQIFALLNLIEFG